MRILVGRRSCSQLRILATLTSIVTFDIDVEKLFSPALQYIAIHENVYELEQVSNCDALSAQVETGLLTNTADASLAPCSSLTEKGGMGAGEVCCAISHGSRKEGELFPS